MDERLRRLEELSETHDLDVDQLLEEYKRKYPRPPWQLVTDGGDTWLKAVLGEVAWAIARTKGNYLAARFHRLARRLAEPVFVGRAEGPGCLGEVCETGGVSSTSDILCMHPGPDSALTDGRLSASVAAQLVLPLDHPEVWC